ncbi:MAG TPA: hypothetical protein VFV48_03310 [Pseudomonadales bacterium]|nr:hypothetical protein [Pseudomonadales bacterium]
MAYVLIVLVLLSLLATLLKVLPSKQERLVARLRKRAMADGFRIRLTGLKESLHWPKEKELPPSSAAYWMYKESLKGQTWFWQNPAAFRALKNTHAASMSQLDELPLENLLKQLGSQLLALELNNAMLTAYWLESEQHYPALLDYFQHYR